LACPAGSGFSGFKERMEKNVVQENLIPQDLDAFDILEAPAAFFSSKDYWDDRYKKGSQQFTEWFLSLKDLQKNELISKIFSTSKPKVVLELGSGNSSILI
jgi:hypothetical protein